MRTKTLLLVAAALAAGIASSMAQTNVYSQNIVGYVNIPVQANNFYLIENPLTGGGADNSITNVIKLDDTWNGTFVFPFSAGAFDPVAETYFGGFGWYPGTNSLAPGQAFFLYPSTNGTVTFTGEVKLGSTNNLAAGFSLAGSAYPAALDLATLGLTGQNGDVVYRYNAGTQQYGQGVTYFNGYGWYDSDAPSGGPTNGPTLSVGEGFFYYNLNGTFSWKQNFSVQ